MSRPFCANQSILITLCVSFLFFFKTFVRLFHFFIEISARLFKPLPTWTDWTGLTSSSAFDGGTGTIGAGWTGPAAGWTDPSFGASGSSVNGRFIVVRIVVRIYG